MIQNDGSGDIDGNENSNGNEIGAGDSNNNVANANNLAARDCTIALTVSVGGSDGEKKLD